MRKNIYLLFCLILCSLLCLSACSGDNPAETTDQEILGAINSYLTQNPIAVISPVSTWEAETPKTIPFDLITPKQSLTKSRAEHPALFALADADVLIVKESTITSDDVFGKTEKLPALHVDLSEEGLKWYMPETGKLRFADIQARQITAREELSPDDLQVTVLLKPENIAPWPEIEEIQAAFPGIAELLNNQNYTLSYYLVYDQKHWQVHTRDDLMQ